MRSNEVLLAIMMILPTQVVLAEDIPVVGLDKNHKEVTVLMSPKEMGQVMVDVIHSVDQSTLAALRVQESKPSPTHWMLRDVCVGLGLNFTEGLGPIWSLSEAPRVRLGYSNSTHPKIPD